MPYSENFLRLVAIGTIYDTDTFSLSMSLIGDGVGTPVTPTSVPSGVVTAFAEWFASPSMISRGCSLTTLKLNEIGTNGRYANPDTVLYDYDTPIPGAATAWVPAQVAYAVSLRTAAARGRAHAGRFYIPMPAQTPNADGQLDDIARGLIANPTYDLLTEINNSVLGWQLAVVSDIGAGTARYVTHMRSGRILDTIRSRRNKLNEDYIDSSPL